MKHKRIWILLGGFIVLGAAFLFLNFRAAWSSTQSEKNVINTGLGEGLPYAMQRREKISIALVGQGPLTPALQTALETEMRQAGIGEIELVRGLETSYSNPVLVVKVGQTRMLWTPFYATSQLSVQAGYSSTGDTTFMGESPATIDDRNGPTLTLYGQYKVSDRSWGLISRLGYHQLLADYLAQNIAAALKELYQVPGT